MSYKTHSTRRAAPIDPRSEVAAASVLRDRCARGEHDEAKVPDDRTVYGPYGRRRPAGERYCRVCGDVLAERGEAGT